MSGKAIIQDTPVSTESKNNKLLQGVNNCVVPIWEDHCIIIISTKFGGKKYTASSCTFSMKSIAGILEPAAIPVVVPLGTSTTSCWVPDGDMWQQWEKLWYNDWWWTWSALLYRSRMWQWNNYSSKQTPNKTNKVECEHSAHMDFHISHSKNMLPIIQIRKTKLIW